MMCLLHSLMLVFCLGPGNAGSQSSSTPLMMNGILGETVTLPLKSPEGEEIKYITWLYNGMSIAFIKPSETGSPLIEVTDPKRRERLDFTPSYSLQLSNLTMADTGFYGAQITSKSSTTVSYYTLRIFSLSKEENQQWPILWTMVGVPVICIVVFVCRLLWKKRKGVFHFSTQQAQCPAEPPRTIEYASVSPGNTVYAQVYHPKKKTEIPKTMKKNESTTIYSTVQHCEESKSISTRATALDNII